MDNLSLFDWSICAGYLVFVFLLGLKFSREQHSTDDYFVGGGKMHWLPIGLSLFAGLFSSLSFVGLPAEAAYNDYHLYLAILFLPFFVAPVVCIWFVPLFFRIGATSCHEYLELRFNRRVRLLASALFMVYMIAWMGNMLNAVGTILQVVLEFSPIQTALLIVSVGLFATIYTTLGGVKAVVWTDAIQAFSLGGGMLLVLFLTVGKVDGGWPAVFEIGSQHNRFDMFHTRFSLNSASVYGAAAYGLFAYLPGQAIAFTAVQRYLSMPSIRAARRSVLLNGLMSGAVCLIFFLAGSAVFAFYHQNASANATNAESLSASLYDQMKKTDTENHQDQLMPRYIMAELPWNGLLGLLLAGLFAAAMSSVDSGINSLTAVVHHDWKRPPVTQSTGKSNSAIASMSLNLRFSRVLCVVFGLLTIAMALTFYFAAGQVFPLVMKIAGMFLGLLLGLFLLGLLVKRAGSTAAFLGMAGGAGGVLTALLLDVSNWWYGAFACIPVLTVGWMTSLLTPGQTAVESPLIE